MLARYGQFLPDRATLRRRAAAIVLALAAEALLVIMLLTLAPFAGREEGSGKRLITIAIPPSPAPSEAPTPRRAAERAAAEAPPAKPPPSVVPPFEPWTPPPGMIVLPKEVYAASDIGRIRSQPTPSTGGERSASAMAGDSEAVGIGPNGETLYAAEWVREPTNAELSYYLPRRSFGPGWAIIACRTVARFKVAECVPLGEGPPGSGLSRSVQEAAWQFLVRPPRVGGKAMVGTWVRIRIDYTERAPGGER